MTARDAFEWDPEKERANRRKHGVSFATVLPVFEDPLALVTRDGDEHGEERWRVVGMAGLHDLLFVSFRRATGRRGDAMKTKALVRIDVDPDKPTKLTEAQKAELDRLRSLPDEDIDTSDIPEADEDFWARAVRNPFYRPIKQQLTLRLDADLVAWFKAQRPDGKGYQTAINDALRHHVQEAERQRGS